MNAAASAMPIVTGATRLFGILGDPIEQVKSPESITTRFRARGINAVCLPFHVRADDLDTVLRGLIAMPNLDGYILTVPHKVRAMPYVDDLSPRSVRIGAVNVVCRRKDGRWAGDMTDGQGMVSALRKAGFDPKGKRALVLGAGGAGSAIIDALGENGAASVTIFEVDQAKANTLIGRLAAAHPGCTFTAGPANPDNCDVIINATPIGMAPKGGAPVQFGKLNPDTVVADVITSPEVTDLLAHARACGCRISTGVQMFDAQADVLTDFLLGR